MQKKRRTPNVFFSWFANYFIHMFLDTSSSDITRQNLGRVSSTSIYGKSEQDVRSMRTMENGKMRLENGFVPVVDIRGSRCFPDGLNMHVGLPIIHTLVLKEHNRICDLISHQYPDYGDEELFTIARNSVVNTLFHIVRTEYISCISGSRTNSTYMGGNPLTRRLAQKKLNAIPIEYLLVYVWHSTVQDKIVLDENRVIHTDKWLKNSLGAIENIFGKVSNKCFVDLLEDALVTPIANGLQVPQTIPTFMAKAEEHILQIQEQNNVASYNDVRRQLNLCPFANLKELVEGTGVTESDMKDVFSDSVENVDFYTGITIENAKPRKNRRLLGEVSTLIISTLAFGIVPVIHGEIQAELPPCIHEEVRKCRKQGFLSTLISHHLPNDPLATFSLNN